MTSASEPGVAQEPTRYAMVIIWSDEDQAYIVSFPEWDATDQYFVHTHVESYAEAVKNAEEVLTELIDLARARGICLRYSPMSGPSSHLVLSG